MIGVPISDPKTPPFEMVNDPPAMSSSARDPFASTTAAGVRRARDARGRVAEHERRGGRLQVRARKRRVPSGSVVSGHLYYLQ